MKLLKRKETNTTRLTKTDKLSDEHAVVIDWIPQWDGGAPMPQVFSNGRKTYLTYLINEPDPNWDGSYVSMIDNTSNVQHSLALVEFHGGTFRFGIAGDELFGALPLSNKGLKGYEAHIIKNSSWMEEIKSIHKRHTNYNEERWKDFNHFMLLFHDEIFEVIAKDYTVETFKTSFEALAIEVAKRMNS